MSTTRNITAERRADYLKTKRLWRLNWIALFLLAGGFALGWISHEVLGLSEIGGALRGTAIGGALWLLRAWPGTPMLFLATTACSTMLLMVSDPMMPLRYAGSLGIVLGIVSVFFGCRWPICNLLERLDDRVVEKAEDEGRRVVGEGYALGDATSSAEPEALRLIPIDSHAEELEVEELPFTLDSLEGVVYNWLSSRPVWPDLLVGAVRAGVRGFNRAVADGSRRFVKEKIVQALGALETRGFATYTDEGWVRGGAVEQDDLMASRLDIEEPKEKTRPQSLDVLGVMATDPNRAWTLEELTSAVRSGPSGAEGSESDGWISEEKLDGALKTVAKSGRECHDCKHHAECQNLPLLRVASVPVAEAISFYLPVSGCSVVIMMSTVLHKIQMVIGSPGAKTSISDLGRRDQYELAQGLGVMTDGIPGLEGYSPQDFDPKAPANPPKIEKDGVSCSERQYMCRYFWRDCEECPNRKASYIASACPWAMDYYVYSDGLTYGQRTGVCADSKWSCEFCWKSKRCPWAEKSLIEACGDEYPRVTIDEEDSERLDFCLEEELFARSPGLPLGCHDQMSGVLSRAADMMVRESGDPVIDFTTTLMTMSKLPGVLSVDEKFAAFALLRRVCYQSMHLRGRKTLLRFLELQEDRAELLPWRWLLEDFGNWATRAPSEDSSGFLTTDRILDIAEEMLWSPKVPGQVKRSISAHLVSNIELETDFDVEYRQRAIDIVANHCKFEIVVEPSGVAQESRRPSGSSRTEVSKVYATEGPHSEVIDDTEKAFGDFLDRTMGGDYLAEHDCRRPMIVAVAVPEVSQEPPVATAPIDNSVQEELSAV